MLKEGKEILRENTKFGRYGVNLSSSGTQSRCMSNNYQAMNLCLTSPLTKSSAFQVPFHIVPIRVDGIVSFLFKPTSIS